MKMAIANSTVKKKWLTVGLVAAAVMLSACDTNDDEVLTINDPVTDAQTPVEREAIGINNVDVDSADDDVAVASADGVAVSDDDDVAVATSDEVEVGTKDDRDMLDGTEESEHISTY